MRLAQPAGEHLRVADPDWNDPFDGAYSMRFGQRWNARGSFPVTYLNANEATARANAEGLLERLTGIGIDIDDLEVGQLPVIVPCVVPDRVVLDVLTDQGCQDVGFDGSYPREASGRMVSHDRCQAIGQHAWDDDLDGIACRSAALLTPEGQELAWFDRPGRRLFPSGPRRPYSP